MNPGGPNDGSGQLEIWLFSHDPDYAAATVGAGATGVIVDWENQGKESRQTGWDTEINYATEADLSRMRAAVRGSLACRINNRPEARRVELRRAVELGANEIWLPMVRSLAEVEECLASLPRGCRLGILAETPEGLALAPELNRLPLSRVYIGLNDLWISSGTACLFSALIDGTVDRFRQEYTGVLGVAGVTHPALGAPVPCRLLLAEMSRLGCGFGVARRAFRRDTPVNELSRTIGEIKSTMLQLSLRTPDQIAGDRHSLEVQVRRFEREALKPDRCSAR